MPEPLKQQLKVGGKMVLPVGRDYQELYLVTRKNGFVTEEKMGVVFVPLIGEEGFKEQSKIVSIELELASIARPGLIRF